MEITLLHFTPLHVCSYAIRTCWDSHAKSDRGGDIDKELIYRVGNKNKHKSTLEHLVYTFEIKGISRACLQELARHRMASLSVKSTRYTLKELRHEESFLPPNEQNMQRAGKYIVLVAPKDNEQHNKEQRPCEIINKSSLMSLEALRLNLSQGIANDIAKYCLPECYKTQLVWTINARSLQNFLHLRSSKAAWSEIQTLAYNLYENLPADHRYLFDEFLEH